MTQTQIAKAAHDLKDLLDKLYRKERPPNVFIFNEQKYTPGVIQIINQFRRISRFGKDDELIGVNEFHIGLCYLFWGQFAEARVHFRKAHLRWSLLHLRAYQAVADLASGITLYHALQYEESLLALQRSQRQIDRIKKLLARGQQTMPPSPIAFLPILSSAVRQAQADLDAAMRAVWDPTGQRHGPDVEVPTEPEGEVRQVPPAGVGRPLISPTLMQEPLGKRYLRHAPDGEWYEVIERHGGFLPDVKQGDWILVDTDERRKGQIGARELLIIGSNINGSIRVEKPHAPRNQYPKYLVQYMRETHGGRMLLIPNEERSLIERDQNVVVGQVLGFWRSTPQSG